jgi:hypothetical protein
MLLKTNPIKHHFIVISNNRFLRLPTSFSVILVSGTQNHFLPVAFILRKKQPFPLVTTCPLEKCKILISLRKIIIVFIIICIFYQANPPLPSLSHKCFFKKTCYINGTSGEQKKKLLFFNHATSGVSVMGHFSKRKSHINDLPKPPAI